MSNFKIDSDQIRSVVAKICELYVAINDPIKVFDSGNSCGEFSNELQELYANVEILRVNMFELMGTTVRYFNSISTGIDVADKEDASSIGGSGALGGGGGSR